MATVTFNPIIPVTINTSALTNEVELIAASLPSTASGFKFIIQLNGSIPYGNTDQVVLNDSATTVLLDMFDRCGNVVRADRLYDAVRYRKMGLIPFSGCNPYNFQAVLGIDNVRVTILNCLPPTAYVAPVTPPTPGSSAAILNNTALLRKYYKDAEAAKAKTVVNGLI